MKVKKYSELIVWQKAMDLTEEVYKVGRLLNGLSRSLLTTDH